MRLAFGLGDQCLALRRRLMPASSEGEVMVASHRSCATLKRRCTHCASVVVHGLRHLIERLSLTRGLTAPPPAEFGLERALHLRSSTAPARTSACAVGRHDVDAPRCVSGSASGCVRGRHLLVVLSSRTLGYLPENSYCLIGTFFGSWPRSPSPAYRQLGNVPAPCRRQGFNKRDQLTEQHSPR